MKTYTKTELLTFMSKQEKQMVATKTWKDFILIHNPGISDEEAKLMSTQFAMMAGMCMMLLREHFSNFLDENGEESKLIDELKAKDEQIAHLQASLQGYTEGCGGTE